MHELTLIKRLLCDNLSAQVLDLHRKTLLNRVVLLTHDLTPNRVELVQDLRDASFAHLSLELLLDLKNCAHSLRRNPVVVFLGVALALSTTHGRLVSTSSRGSSLLGLDRGGRSSAALSECLLDSSVLDLIIVHVTVLGRLFQKGK